jgi:hypothetical protein
MATPTHDATFFHDGGIRTTGASVAITATVANNVDRILFLETVLGANHTISAVTYAGTSLSLMSSVSLSTDFVCNLYTLIAPPVGTGTAVVTFQTSWTWSGLCVVSSFYNVDQSLPTGNVVAVFSNTTTSLTVECSTTVGDVVLGMLAARFAGTASCTCTGATEIWGFSSTQVVSEFYTMVPAASFLSATYVIVGSTPNIQHQFSLHHSSAVAAVGQSRYTLALTGSGT